MKHSLTILLFLIAPFLMIRGQCQTKGKTDSLTKEKSRIINKFLNLSNKDVIADIGTGSGYSLIPIANECAGCKFTVEDIDSISCNPIALSRRIAKTGNKITINNFSFYYGTERSTNLPSATYNKVLIFDVIHEMTYKTEMLYDIKRILQKNGTVFIEEILVHRKIKKDRICNYPFLTEPAFKEILAANKFMILREEMTFDTGNNRFIKIFECAPGL